MVVHVRVLNFVNDHFIHGVFISCEFIRNLCEFLLLLVCIGTCISKFYKHVRDVLVHVRDVVVHGFHIIMMFVSHGFHIRVMFVGRGFDATVNVFEVTF